MRFFENAPDLPNELLMAVDTDNAIFFCGAGVSMNADLPSFAGLVDQVYVELNEEPAELEAQALKKNEFDRVLGELERRLIPGLMREQVKRILGVDRDEVPTLATHEALLDLSTNADGEVHLVTTNFDGLFELVPGRSFQVFEGPALPVPQKGDWSGLVHLHGRVDHGSMVLTSADFGSAYLYEQWAARFVVQLLRNFTLVFVGYQIEDPTMRYLLDAFSLNLGLETEFKRPFALVPGKSSDRQRQTKLWTGKNIEPVFYEKDATHSKLHQTLKAWATMKAGGHSWSESTVSNIAARQPEELSLAEVSQLCWVVSDPSGAGAELFAHQSPPPSLFWLDVFEREGLLRFEHEDHSKLALFGHRNEISKPASLPRTYEALGYWLARHIDDPALLQKVLKAGGCLHPAFKDSLRRLLDSREGELMEGLRAAWEVVTNDAFSPGAPPVDLHALEMRLSNDDWSSRSKFEFLSAFTPRIEKFKEPYSPVPSSGEDERHLATFLRADVGLYCEYPADLIEAIKSRGDHKEILGEIADDLTSLLRQALEIQSMLEGVSEEIDFTFIHVPSLEPESQNQFFENWTCLIPLVFAGFLSLAEKSPERARGLANRWRTIPFPIFSRLRLKAMTSSSIFAPSDRLQELTRNDGDGLWKRDLRYEGSDLLLALWDGLDEDDRDDIMGTIIEGPSPSRFRTDLSQEELNTAQDRLVFGRLGLLVKKGKSLPPIGAEHLTELRDRHDGWIIENVEEQPPGRIVASVGEPTDFSVDELATLAAPRLYNILRNHPNQRRGLLESWKNLVGEYPMLTLEVLQRIKKPRGAKDIAIWGSALLGLSNTDASSKERRQVADMIDGWSNYILRKLTYEIANWLQAWRPKRRTSDGRIFWAIWKKTMSVAIRLRRSGRNRLGDEAVAHPLFDLSDIVFFELMDESPRVGQRLPKDIRRYLEFSIGLAGPSHLLLKWSIARRVFWLFQIDPDWTRQSILPWFSWSRRSLAKVAWSAYLCHGEKIDRALFRDMKRSFVDTAKHLIETDDPTNNYSTFLVAAGIRGIAPDEQGELWDFGPLESKQVLRVLDPEQLRQAAWTLWRYLSELDGGKATAWDKRVGPWIQKAWPLDSELRSASVSDYLIMAAIESQSAFSRAVKCISPLLVPHEGFSHALRRLSQSKHPDSRPTATLRLLTAIGPDQEKFPHTELRSILDRVLDAAPSLGSDSRFKSYDTYLRRYGR